MGEVIKFVPKALVDFEKSALRLVAASSRFLADTPAAIRVSRALHDETMQARIDRIIIPLSALAGAIDLIELHAEQIVQAVEPNEPVVLHVQNAGPDHNVICHTTVRENVIYVSEFEFRNRNWIDRLTSAEPQILIEYQSA